MQGIPEHWLGPKRGPPHIEGGADSALVKRICHLYLGKAVELLSSGMVMWLALANETQARDRSLPGRRLQSQCVMLFLLPHCCILSQSPRPLTMGMKFEQEMNMHD